MRKKVLGILFLMIIICGSTIFGQTLVTTIYDQQGNKYSLYDDHTWIMNDETWNDKASYNGKYIIKEDGLKDVFKIGLILDGTYPGTDEWKEAIVFSNIGLGILSVDDLLEIAEINIYLEINNNKLKVNFEFDDSSENYVFEKVTPFSNKLGFYIQDNTLFILDKTGSPVCYGIFKGSDKFEIDFANLVNEFGKYEEIDDLSNSFFGYEEYLFLTLEKE